MFEFHFPGACLLVQGYSISFSNLFPCENKTTVFKTSSYGHSISFPFLATTLCFRLLNRNEVSMIYETNHI